MLNNPNCTVVSSFTRENKLYITLEIDLGTHESVAFRSGVDIGNFRISVDKNENSITIALYYGDHLIKDWTIQVPDNACVHLEDQTFEIVGIKIKIKDIQVCLEGDKVCFHAGVYIKNPITGDYNKVGDINLCS